MQRRRVGKAAEVYCVGMARMPPCPRGPGHAARVGTADAGLSRNRTRYGLHLPALRDRASIAGTRNRRGEAAVNDAISRRYQ